MRQTRLFLNTMRENPADAEIASHQLMVRAGLVRQLTAGVYTFLPLGYRVLKKIEAIVESEMDAIGAQEVLLPAMQPEELWVESGRSETYGPDMFRLADRHQRKVVLGPTHEEVVTNLIDNEVSSYRQLPITLYQIQTKFRDEVRPRGGLLRVREFRMKDAYSFHTSPESLDETYRDMHDAYCRIFERLGIGYRAVEADSGAIGGSGGSHEFMVLSEAGEDTVAGCTSCDYSANLEKAVAVPLPAGDASATPAPLVVPTPGTKTIEELCRLLDVPASRIIKVVVYFADGQAVGVCLRGDHEVNEAKLKAVLGADHLRLATADEVLSAAGKRVGFVGPDAPIRMLFDRDIQSVSDGVAAMAGEDEHKIHVVPGRDFDLSETVDIRNVVDGDACPRCQSPLAFYNGIEVGHIFKLGTRYTDAFDTTYLDANGAAHRIIMGCYGLGTSRVLAAIVEQSHDEKGIIWPSAVAPFQVHIVLVSVKDEAQVKAAESLYHRLYAAGVEVLLDDRDERPGVKFNDADLMGVPVRVTIGNKIKEGQVELKDRKTGDVQVLSAEEAFATVLGMVK
ncbi:proline--tRNA ligase [Alicyclobacillus ferrooxydans]|uniref:Proline--tRNA ligase n=1 Tax=Alicyclobacillus ferrooxydans TaxID=471514 RepID=A0A0P9CLC0_9BACL|nr:proline--tRNA ligase [Alicyclobacillus ferrooxydans]KPV39823.1 prolyl-tRNA synthetase [Alicyclobacillus ferrooxydans]